MLGLVVSTPGGVVCRSGTAGLPSPPLLLLKIVTGRPADLRKRGWTCPTAEALPNCRFPGNRVTTTCRSGEVIGKGGPCPPPAPRPGGARGRRGGGPATLVFWR